VRVRDEDVVLKSHDYSPYDRARERGSKAAEDGSNDAPVATESIAAGSPQPVKTRRDRRSSVLLGGCKGRAMTLQDFERAREGPPGPRVRLQSAERFRIRID